MKTREYEFNVAIETANLPDPGTPTDDNDTVSKGYVDGKFALLEDWGNDVADITALRAVAAADRFNGQVATVVGINTLYMFNSSSTATDDGDNVIQPDVGSGRWLKTGAAGGASGLFSDLTLDQDSRIGKILMGIEDNTSQYWRRRFHIHGSHNGEETKFIEMQDPEGRDLKELSVWQVDNDTTSIEVVDSPDYLGYRLTLEKGEKRTFKIKKGVDFFGLIYTRATAGSQASDSVTVTIDGVDASSGSLGLVDENGDSIVNPFDTTQASSVRYQFGRWYFGLDKNTEQTVVVENTDSGVNNFFWSAVEIGSSGNSSELALDHSDIRVSAGRAIVRGQDVQIPETELTFSPSTGYGKASIMRANTVGTTSILEGSEGWMSITKPAVTITPGDTTLQMKSTYHAPNKGIFMMQFPLGTRVVGSYTGKDETDPHNHFLTGVIYESDFEDYTPLDTFEGSTGSFNAAVTVYLIADGTENAIEVTASNQNVDFTVDSDGASSPTQYTAVIPVGLYSADALPLGPVVAKQMQAVAGLTKNSFFVKYSELNHRWTIGVTGVGEVDQFDLDFGTGPSGPAGTDTSLAPDLGFVETDLSGEFSYIGTVEKESMAWRCFERGEFIDGEVPTIKHTSPPTYLDDIGANDLRERGMVMSFPANSEGVVYKIYTPEDVCGIDISVMTHSRNAVIHACIDKQNKIHLMQPDKKIDSNFHPRGQIMTASLTFPVGTHEIVLTMGTADEFEIEAGTNRFVMAGHRYHYPRPPLERLAKNEAALKSFLVRPLKLFAETYQHDYTGSNGKLTGSGITKNGGGWSAATGAGQGNSYALNSTLNDSIDCTFTLDGNGGGIAIEGYTDTNTNDELAVYLAAGSTGTNSAANEIDRFTSRYSGTQQHVPFPGIIGLPAGQYTLRLRNEGAGQLLLTGFTIFDTVQSELEIFTNQETTDTLRTASYPAIGWGTVIHPLVQDNQGMVPDYLTRTRYRDGMVETDYALPSPTFLNAPTTEVQRDSHWYTAYIDDGGQIGTRCGIFNHAEVMFYASPLTSANTQALEPIFDGTTGTAFNAELFTNGGTTASGSHNIWGPQIVMDYNRKGTSDMSSSTTFVVNDTTSMRVGDKCIISADGETDSLNRIDSIVTDTSVTLARPISAFGNFTTANNVSMKFSGLHRMEANISDTATHRFNCFGYLPLPVRLTDFKNFVSKVNEVAMIEVTNVTNLEDLPRPQYKDGVYASWGECIIQTLNMGASESIDFQTGLRDLPVTGTVRYRITAIRQNR